MSKINYKTTCQYTSLSNKRKSNFHTVTINIKKDLGGVLDDEVIDVWQQVLEDYKSGLVVAATMGIELVNESRHLHSSLILTNPTLGSVTQKRYEKLIKPGRLDAPKVSLRGDKEIRTPVTVQVEQPKTKNMEHYRAYRWLAYSHKERAKDFNDVLTFNRDVNWCDTREFKTLGLFSGPDTEQNKIEFANVVFTSWQKKLTKRIGAPETIWLNNNLAEQAMRFIEATGQKMEWIHDDSVVMAKNQAAIITKMVLNKIGKERYHLSSNFFDVRGEKKTDIYTNLCSMKPPSNRTSRRYEQELYKCVEQRMAKAHRVIFTVSEERTALERQLMKENQQLTKMNAKLKKQCELHVVTIYDRKGKKMANIEEQIREVEDSIRVEKKKEFALNSIPMGETMPPRSELHIIDMVVVKIQTLEEKKKVLEERLQEMRASMPGRVMEMDNDTEPAPKRRRVDVVVTAEEKPKVSAAWNSSIDEDIKRMMKGEEDIKE